MSRIASQSLLGFMTLAMAGVLVLLWAHPMRELAVSGCAVAIIFFALALERRARNDNAAPMTSRAEMVGDIGSFVLVFGLLDGALKWITPFVILALVSSPHSLDWPLWIEVPIVFFWVEFAAWASHWAHHKFKPLWALHAMHHSPDHLYTLNNFRFHPFNHAINHVAMIFPVLAIGFSTDALLVYSAITLPVLLLQHSDIDFDFGFLNHFFNTNQLHRWHHSAAETEGTKNLGRALVIWDKAFGTYMAAPPHAKPAKIGLFHVSRAFPSSQNFWRQILWPFQRACCS